MVGLSQLSVMTAVFFSGMNLFVKASFTVINRPQNNTPNTILKYPSSSLDGVQSTIVKSTLSYAVHDASYCMQYLFTCDVVYLRKFTKRKSTILCHEDNPTTY